MNRFGDTLRKALNTTPPALGFRPAAPARPRMVLVAGLNELSDEPESWIRGADAAIFGTNIKVRELKGVAKTLGMPWGVWLDGSPQAAKQAESAGADFLAFDPAKTALDTAGEDAGKVMAIEASFENSLLHSLGELPIEAVILRRDPQNALTWLDLMHFRRFADIIAKPLLVPLAPDAAPALFKALWEAGVDGVIVEALAAGEIQKLRRSMDALDLPARRKWLRVRPLVPLITQSPGPIQREEEEQDEEDDE